MKRLFILLLVLVNLSAFGQTTVTADRVVANRGFYLKDRWVDSIGVDTSMQGEMRSLPSSDAVYRMVAGRLATLQAALQFSLNDSTSVLRDSINALRADIASGGGGASYTPTITTQATSTTLSTSYETWVFTGSSAATFTLSGATAARYTVKNRGADTLTLSGSIYSGGAVASLSLPPGWAYTLQNDGTYWDVTATYNPDALVTSSGGTSGPTQLDTPGSFSATASGQTAIDLAWSDVANESSYLLEVSDNGTSGWATLTSPAANATSYSHTGLTASTTKYYRLSAIGDGTTYSNSGYATANATTAAAGGGGGNNVPEADLILDLDADSLVASSSSVISSWTDKVGGVVFTPHGGGAPLYTTTDPDFGNAVVFDGTVSLIGTTPMANDPTITAYMVINATGNQTLLSNRYSASGLGPWWTLYTHAIEEGVGGSAAVHDEVNVKRILRFEFTASDIKVYENGVLKATQTLSGAVNNTDNKLIVAAFSDNTMSSLFEGVFNAARILIYGVSQDSAAKTETENALKTLYGISY